LEIEHEEGADKGDPRKLPEIESERPKEVHTRILAVARDALTRAFPPSPPRMECFLTG
jgi:hypothetical protein